MPTGYTNILIEDKEVSFNEFVLNCARAFGACITMRDESFDKQIPYEFIPSDFHVKELKKYEDALIKFKELTKEDYKKKADRKFKTDLKYYEEVVAKNNFQQTRYYNMLQKVKEWNPPTPDHRELKNFMIQQIESSIKFDCYEPKKPILLTPEEWANKELKDILQSAEYHIKENTEEINKVKDRNAWIKNLRISLGETK